MKSRGTAWVDYWAGRFIVKSRQSTGKFLDIYMPSEIKEGIQSFKIMDYKIILTNDAKKELKGVIQ
jgi:hypothetical protein